MANENEPLTEQDFTDLKDRLKALDEADQLIDKAIRGGVDMTEQRQRSKELRDQLLRLRQAFFPGRD